MARYIHVRPGSFDDPGGFEIALADEIGEQGYHTLLDPEAVSELLSAESAKRNPLSLESIVHYDLLYPSIHRSDRWQGKGEEVMYDLAAPDGWVIALAYVMWEGIVQGATWDVVKEVAKRALYKMHALGVAPDERGHPPSNTKIEMGFKWTELAEERGMRRLFLGLSIIHEELPAEKRAEVSTAGRKHRPEEGQSPLGIGRTRGSERSRGTPVQHVEDAAMPRRHRRWTGNDASHREHHARVPLTEIPMFLQLSWREDRNSPVTHVANLRLDLPALLAGRHVREDGPGHVRLRFAHDESGEVCIQTKSGEPRLVVGRA